MKFIIKLLSLIIIFFTAFNLFAAKDNLAVLDFNSNGVPSFFGKAVSDVITTELKKYNDLTIIERSQIDRILKEKNMSIKSAEDVNNSILIGEMLSADILLLGSISKLGEKYSINAKFIDIKTGSVIVADSETCYVMDDIDKASKVLAVKLLNKLTGKEYNLPNRDYKKNVENSNFEVAFDYRRGMIYKLPIPTVSMPTVFGDPVYTKTFFKNVEYDEFNFGIGYYFNRVFGVIASVNYFNSQDVRSPHPDAYAENEITSERIDIYYVDDKNIKFNFRGSGVKLGGSLNKHIGRATFFLNLSLSYSYFLLDEISIGKFHLRDWVDGYHVYDQLYDISFTENVSVLNAEFNPGIKINFNDIFGIKFSVGYSHLLYGHYMSKLKIKQLTTDSSGIVPEYANIDSKVNIDDFKKDAPVNVFLQVGVFCKL
ncbi:MAG: hypothetical protein JW982_01470 [Spirochaetes bacterium]|nr:hypothetical protein [Spirochaetota bacterium]